MIDDYLFHEEFRDDLNKWVAEIDRETLTVSFREPKIQFSTILQISFLTEPVSDNIAFSLK